MSAVEIHNVSIEPNDAVICSCRDFHASVAEMGTAGALSVGHAHLANPRLPLEAVLAFVEEEPLA